MTDELDLAQAYEWIVRELQSPRPVADAIGGLIDFCESSRPHGHWDEFRSLPYADLEPLSRWLMRPFREQPPGESIRALWFGLFNPCTDAGEVVADIYVSGLSVYDPEGPSWDDEPEWWPDSRYAESAILSELYRRAYQPGGLENEAEYPLCLGYAAFALRDLLSRLTPEILARCPNIDGVTVGFDSGDFIELGPLDGGG